jgi:hypothetical protein
MSVHTDFPASDDDDDEEMVSEGGDGREEDTKEWVAQVEPGVLITFVSMAQGGNDLQRIRFRFVRPRTRNESSFLLDKPDW